MNGSRRSQLCRSQSRLRIGPGCRTCRGPALISRCDQCPTLAERIGRSDWISLSGACAPSRSRRSSSMRARMAAKSSAARGRFTAFPPILVIGRGPAIGCERPSVTLLTLGKKARLRACGGLLNPRPAARLVRWMALIGFGQRVGLLTVVVLMADAVRASPTDWPAVTIIGLVEILPALTKSSALLTPGAG